MNKTELVIDLNEFPGGVGLWPSLASAFSSRVADPTNEPVNGIHVHARKKHGKAKVIDFTFPNVFIKANIQSSLVNNELFKIDEIDARAYWASQIFGANLQLIFCPSCGHAHADHEESAIRNHINHKCENCGFVFHSEFPCVSNPLMWLKNHFSEFDDTRRPVLVNRVCEIHSEDTIGGIEMWGSAPAILWTNSSTQEEGIHFHLYNASGSKRLIDETYREVKTDEYLITHKMLRYYQAQSAMNFLRPFVESVDCPHCGVQLFDEGIAGTQPSTELTCSNGHDFTYPRKVLCNPFVRIAQKLRVQ